MNAETARFDRFFLRSVTYEQFHLGAFHLLHYYLLRYHLT